MKKHLILPGAALAAGFGGFALRKWQLHSAFNLETGLFTSGAPATYALLILSGLFLLLLPLLLRGTRTQPDGFLSAFRCPQPGQMSLMAAAGLLFCAAGVINLMEGFRLWSLWKSLSPLERPSTLFTICAAQLLTGALALPAGAGILALGRSAYRQSNPYSAGYLASFPALTGLVWLFSTHLSNGTQPVLMRYGFALAAAASLTLGHYYAAGFLFDRPYPRRLLFWSLLGVMLGLISLADGPSLGNAILTIAFILSSLGFSYSLLYNAYGPGWPAAPQTTSNEMPQAPGQASSEDH